MFFKFSIDSVSITSVILKTLFKRQLSDLPMKSLYFWPFENHWADLLTGSTVPGHFPPRIKAITTARTAATALLELPVPSETVFSTKRRLFCSDHGNKMLIFTKLLFAIYHPPAHFISNIFTDTWYPSQNWLLMPSLRSLTQGTMLFLLKCEQGYRYEYFCINMQT